MKRLLIIGLITFIGCKNHKENNQTSLIDSLKNNLPEKHLESSDHHKSIWVDRLNGNKYPLPDSIGGKPVSFYLDNSMVEPIAKALYNGQYRPTDNDSTIQLLSNVTTNDSTLRPFYRWCVDFTISISDGALAEYPGRPALQYALKFPKEFLNYTNNDTTGRRYANWVGIIAYSGLENYNRSSGEVEKEIISKMISKCPSCEEEEKKQIKKFAKEIASAAKRQY